MPTMSDRYEALKKMMLSAMSSVGLVGLGGVLGASSKTSSKTQEDNQNFSEQNPNAQQNLNTQNDTLTGYIQQNSAETDPISLHDPISSNIDASTPTISATSKIISASETLSSETLSSHLTAINISAEIIEAEKDAQFVAAILQISGSDSADSPKLIIKPIQFTSVAGHHPPDNEAKSASADNVATNVESVEPSKTPDVSTTDKPKPTGKR